MFKYLYCIDTIKEINCISEDHADWKRKKSILKAILCSLMICICLAQIQIITSVSAADYRLEIYGNANLDNAVKRLRRTPLQADGACEAPPHKDGAKLS